MCSSNRFAHFKGNQRTLQSSLHCKENAEIIWFHRSHPDWTSPSDGPEQSDRSQKNALFDYITSFSTFSSVKPHLKLFDSVLRKLDVVGVHYLSAFFADRAQANLYWGD